MSHPAWQTDASRLILKQHAMIRRLRWAVAVAFALGACLAWGIVAMIQCT